MQLGDPLRCRLGFAVSELFWLLRLQPETLVFQCRDTDLFRKLIGRQMNCIMYRQNAFWCHKERSRLREKVEKTLLFLARPGWHQVLPHIAKPTPSLCGWMDAMLFLWCHWQNHVILLGRSDDIMWPQGSCGKTFLLGVYYRFLGHLKQSFVVVAVLVCKNWSLCCVSSTNHQILCH